MATDIGIDLGTSAVKALLVNENGVILNEKSCSYPLLIPKENYSEQNPNEWFEKMRERSVRFVQKFPVHYRHHHPA